MPDLASTAADRIKHLLERGIKLPPLPASGLELMNILRQPSDAINVQGVAALVENDPTLAANLLRVANSPAYGTVRTVNRVSQAIMVLGLDETIQMLNYYLMRKLFPRVPALPHFDPQQFWLHAWGCAMAARHLGQPQYLVHCIPGELYLAGLLHDIGKIMMAIYLTDEFGQCLALAHESQRPLHEVEQEQLGTNHAELGGLLLDAWNLPQPILAAVGGHHNPSAIPAAERELVSLIELANTLAHEAAIGGSGNPAPTDLADTALYCEGRSPLVQPSAEAGILQDIILQLQAKAKALDEKAAPGGDSGTAEPAATSVSVAPAVAVPAAEHTEPVAPATGFLSRVIRFFRG